MENSESTGGLPLIDWLGAPVKQSINSVFAGINEAVEALDIFKKYRRKHFRLIRKNANQIKILGMNSPLKLADIYYPAYVSTTIFRRLYERDWYSVSDRTPMRINRTRRSSSTSIRADQYVENHDLVMILGGPGSGKTTFLRFLALAYTSSEIFKESELKSSYFPFYIRLPDIAKKDVSIATFAKQSLRAVTDDYAEAFVERILNRGLAIILLDSLDEVPLEKKSDVIERIRNFRESYPNTKIVLSCRTADNEETIEGFHEVELTRLTPDAIERITKAWFGDDPEQAENLLAHLKNDKGVASLTETPLLLSLLCIQFRHDLTLPKRKAELYRRCVDALLRDWDASRNFRRTTAYENLSDDRKERLFEHLAAYFFRQSPKFVFPETQLIEVAADYVDRFNIRKQEVPGMLREVESHHGILEKFSMDSYSFSHPSFQEFFTARNALAKRIDLKIVKEYLEEDEWAGVIEFIIALREEPEDLVQVMVDKSQVKGLETYPAMARRTKILWLLYRCLASGPALPNDVYETCYQHIINAQIDALKVFRKGGVVPYAVLMQDGVRHSYVYWRKRATLYRALQPLRRLANAIYSLPLPRYSNLVLERVKEIEKEEPSHEKFALLLCLLIPIAPHTSSKVKPYLQKVKKQAKAKFDGRFFVNQIDESLANILS